MHKEYNALLLSCAMVLAATMWYTLQAVLSDDSQDLKPFTCGNTEIYFQCDETVVQHAAGPTLCRGDMVLTASGMVRSDSYNPCEHSTCLGVRCPPGSNLVQGYRPLPAEPLTNVIITSSDAFAASRCSCIPDFTRPYQTVPIASVQPDSPEAQQNDPRCNGLLCKSPLQFLFSADGTPEGCQCCDKPYNALSVIPIPATATFKGCGAEEPVSSSQFLDFMRSMCPETDSINAISDSELLRTMDSFCCTLFDVQAPPVCGAAILSMGGYNAVSQCEYTATNDQKFHCCAAYNMYNGNASEIRNLGPECDRSLLPSRDNNIITKV